MCHDASDIVHEVLNVLVHLLDRKAVAGGTGERGEVREERTVESSRNRAAGWVGLDEEGCVRFTGHRCGEREGQRGDPRRTMKRGERNDGHVSLAAHRGRCGQGERALRMQWRAHPLAS